MTVLSYPSMLEDYVTLSNGARVRIRPLGRCEDAVVRELYAHLSPRTRYLRFFSPMPFLPESIVRLLTCVDYRRKLSLVAEHETSTGRDIVGLGSFDAIDDTSVEVALVVRDDWQRQRVGTALASRVLRAAEELGYHRFVAHVLGENVAIRRLLRRFGEVVSATMSGSVSELAFVRHPTVDRVDG